MLLWIFIAIIAHVGNALVFVADKVILGSDSKVVGDPVRFAAWSGLVAGGTGLILPFFFRWPTAPVIFWSLVGGVWWVLALWLFFVGLNESDPSRVVPIAGSAVPLFTLLLSGFLGGGFPEGQLWSILFLIAGGAVLSISFGGAVGLSKKAWWATMGGGASFAAHFTTVDFIYDIFEPFNAAFAYARLGVSAVAIVLLAWLYFNGLLGQSRVSKTRARKKPSKKRVFTFVTIVFVSSKILGAVALYLQNLAVKLGDVTIVNSLQGTQYVFLLVLAIIISQKWPKLFEEEIHRVALWQKLAGILLIGVGLALLV